MLKLKLQYFGHLKRRVDSLEETLMLGGIGGKRRRGETAQKVMETEGCVKGPKKLGVFGASYIYPIFLELNLIK